MASTHPEPASATKLQSLATPPGRRTWLRVVRRMSIWLFGGLIINIAVALAIAGYFDPTSGTVASASAVTGDFNWCVTSFETRGSQVILSDFSFNPRTQQSWSAQQVLGPPNTGSVGDIGTAWAQSTQDGQEEWLELTYAQAVVPKSVKVYETYNQGSLTKVIAYREGNGEPVTAWEGTDPSPLSSTAIGVSEVPLQTNFPTKRVRIVLDSVRVKGWNEIDAVGLVDRADNVQWAMRVKASSVYGQGSTAPVSTVAGGSGPEGLLPRWGDLHEEPPDPETHVVGAYGWPAPVLWGSWRGPANLNTTASTPVSYPVTSTFLGPGSGFGGSGLIPPPSGPPSPPSSPLPIRISMPYHPILSGVVINSMLYAIPVALAHLWLIIVPRFLIEVARVRRGACVRCGYDLQWDFINGCSECGWRRRDRESSALGPPTESVSHAPRVSERRFESIPQVTTTRNGNGSVQIAESASGPTH